MQNGEPQRYSCEHRRGRRRKTDYKSLKHIRQDRESETHDRLVGVVVKVSASRAEGPGFESCMRQDFFGVESYLKIGTPVATLPGAWRYRVSAGTGRPGISIL